VDEVILRALKEDVHYLDLSCEYLFAPEQRSEAYVLAKSPGLLCGAEIFARVFTLLDSSCREVRLARDGEPYAAGDILLRLEGPTRALLQGERTALNLLQHLCGAATATAALVRAVDGTEAAIAETRKTLPGLRALQKYAVTCGGGRNHRYNLSDGVMLKDNHIDACGSIGSAVAAVRAKIGHMVKIEVEVRSPDETRQAFDAGAEAILLDHMTTEQMRESVAYVRARDPGKRVLLEASGDITPERAREIALTGVDLLSVGAVTHSVRAANLSMRVGVPKNAPASFLF
jgi:nicotinate-nucleotide pyrophosphorylase (carboxylating)